MTDTIIVLMKYDEPEWKQTFECAYETKCPILIADRSGCGSMAKAFNDAVNENIDLVKQYKYIWFVSNIIFTPDDFKNLKSVIDTYGYVDCIHPSFDSDHKHLQQDIHYYAVKEVPFVEFTAPLIKSEIFINHLLDQNMPFVGHDLDWSYRVKKNGYRLFVHHGIKIGHTYIRYDQLGHAITDIRSKVRRSWITHTENALTNKYGSDWKKVLKYEGAV